MKTSESMGGSVYCGDPDFDRYTGRPIAQYTVTRPLRNGGMLVTHKVVIDIGRSAEVVPVDGDRHLRRESLPVGDGSNATNATNWVDKRRDRRMAQLVQIIQEHGPMLIKQAAELLGCNVRTVRDLLAMRNEVQIIGRRAMGGRWIGFPGQTIPTTSKE